jgi:transcriptional regulator
MYVPKLYRNENPEEVHRFIREFGFAILVNQTEGKLWATHLPLELDQNEQGQEVLLGHMSRANPQWREMENNAAVMAIFQGPHAYISSSWYNHENVPTWNYIAVHVYGTMKILEGEALLESLKKLVNRYEAGSEKPVTVEGFSEKFLSSHLKGLVGFEITITDVQAAYKLSQNRDETNHGYIVKELEKQGDAQAKGVAEYMRKIEH